MGRYSHSLLRLSQRMFLQYTGMETDLIFNRGIELTNFASYVLLENAEGRASLMEYCCELIRCDAEHSADVILDSATWVANRDRAALIGYSPKAIAVLNQAAIALFAEARDAHGDLPTVISGQIGPRGDAYAPADQMREKEAQDYHSEQIAAFAETDVDIISLFTLTYPKEAIGGSCGTDMRDMDEIARQTAAT